MAYKNLTQKHHFESQKLVVSNGNSRIDGQQFVNTIDSKINAKIVVEHLSVNTIADEALARNVEELGYANTT